MATPTPASANLWATAAEQHEENQQADRDTAGELEAAVALLRRRFGAAIPASERERERALGVLARKGYDLELAYEAVRAFAGSPE